MKIKGIDTRNPNLTKDEEIKILSALCEAFKGTGNYLEKLFTPALLNNCTQLIKDDFLPDIEGSRQISHEEKIRLEAKCDKLAEALGEANNRIVEKDKAIRDWQDAGMVVGSALKDALKDKADLEDRITELERELDKVKRFRIALKDFLAQD